MIRSSRTAASLALAGVVLLASCGGGRPSKYYMLAVPPASAPAAAALPVDLLVGRVTAPQLLRDDRIVYQATSNQLGTYEYHRWAEPPAMMLEELLLRAMRDGGRFRSVQSQKSNTRGDFVVRGRLYEFGEVSGSPLTARMKLELEAYTPLDGKVVYVQLFTHTEQVQGKEVVDVVAALDRAVQRTLADFTAGLADRLAKVPPKS